MCGGWLGGWVAECSLHSCNINMCGMLLISDGSTCQWPMIEWLGSRHSNWSVEVSPCRCRLLLLSPTFHLEKNEIPSPNRNTRCLFSSIAPVFVSLSLISDKKKCVRERVKRCLSIHSCIFARPPRLFLARRVKSLAILVTQRSRENYFCTGRFLLYLCEYNRLEIDVREKFSSSWLVFWWSTSLFFLLTLLLSISSDSASSPSSLANQEQLSNVAEGSVIYQATVDARAFLGSNLFFCWRKCWRCGFHCIHLLPSPRIVPCWLILALKLVLSQSSTSFWWVIDSFLLLTLTGNTPGTLFIHCSFLHPCFQIGRCCLLCPICLAMCLRGSLTLPRMGGREFDKI